MQGGCLETLDGGVPACVAGVWKGREREFLAREKREDRGARGEREGRKRQFPSFPPRAPLAFLSRWKLPFPSLSNAYHAGWYSPVQSFQTACIKSLRERHTLKHSEERHPKIGELLLINVIIVRQETEINSD